MQIDEEKHTGLLKEESEAKRRNSICELSNRYFRRVFENLGRS
jgi:hypothetical protein